MSNEVILHLTLKKKWFDMIKSGIKKEEYREIKPYWDKRLIGKNYTHIIFKNGYQKDSPQIKIEYKGLFRSYGIIEWGALPETEHYIIKLGRING